MMEVGDRRKEQALSAHSTKVRAHDRVPLHLRFANHGQSPLTLSSGTFAQAFLLLSPTYIPRDTLAEFCSARHKTNALDSPSAECRDKHSEQ